MVEKSTGNAGTYNNKRPPGRQHAMDISQRFAVIINVFEHIEAVDIVDTVFSNLRAAVYYRQAVGSQYCLQVSIRFQAAYFKIPLTQ